MSDSYTLQVEMEPLRVEVTFHENMRTDMALEAVHEMKRLGAEHGTCLYFFDITGVGSDASRGEQFRFVEIVTAEKLLVPEDRVAILVAPLSSEHGFVEMAMQDRGYEYRYFRSKPNALEWLADN